MNPDELPDDVMGRTAEAFNGALDGGVTDGEAEALLAALLDAGIVTLIPDPDTDAIEALYHAATDPKAVMQRLHAAGWTVAPLTDVEYARRMRLLTEGEGDYQPVKVAPPAQRREPCDNCGGEGKVYGDFHRNGAGVKGTERDCPTCKGSGERPTDPCDGERCGGGWIGGDGALNAFCMCDESGKRPADPQHDHDPDECDECMGVRAEGYRDGHNDASAGTPQHQPRSLGANDTDCWRWSHYEGWCAFSHDCDPDTIGVTEPTCDRDTCDGFHGYRGVEPQHDHDPDECHDCGLLAQRGFDAGREWANSQNATAPPSAGDPPGDGWVRYRVSDTGYVRLQTGSSEWVTSILLPTDLDLHPDPDHDPERPTDGWEVPDPWNVGDGWAWEVREPHYLGGYLARSAGVARTEQEARADGQAARAAWDIRLGGAS